MKHAWKPMAPLTMRKIGKQHALRLGICVTCRVNPIDYHVSGIRCHKCLKFRSDNEIAARLKLAQAGMCERCRKRPVYYKEGRLCLVCLSVIRTYKLKNRSVLLKQERDRRAARIAKGECPRCGETLEVGVDTGQLCAHCRTSQIEMKNR